MKKTNQTESITLPPSHSIAALNKSFPLGSYAAALQRIHSAGSCTLSLALFLSFRLLHLCRSHIPNANCFQKTDVIASLAVAVAVAVGMLVSLYLVGEAAAAAAAAGTVPLLPLLCASLVCMLSPSAAAASASVCVCSLVMRR